MHCDGAADAHVIFDQHATSQWGGPLGRGQTTRRPDPRCTSLLSLLTGDGDIDETTMTAMCEAWRVGE